MNTASTVRRSRRLLLRFAAQDVLIGSALTLALFTGTLASVAGLYLGYATAGTMTSPPLGMRDAISVGAADGSGDIGVEAGIFLVVVLCVVIVTSMTLLVFGPIAGLMSLLLRRVTIWPVHVAAYCVLGAIAAFCVELAYLHTTNVPALLSNPAATALATAAAFSAGAGWLIAWRLAVRRDRADAALHALVRANSNAVPFRTGRS